MTYYGGYGSATGGGWRFINSLQADGPTYEWRDISGVFGSTVTFTGDDQNLGPYSIGFSFPYYGLNFTTFRLSANGWLSFTSNASDMTSYTNVSLPSGNGPENIIAPWWDDLSPQRVGTAVRYWSNNTDSLVVSFSNVQSFSGGGVYNFQIVLQASGKITYQYRSMGTARLNSATIGFQNGARTRGLNVINNQLYIQDNMAIACYPQPLVALVPASGTVPAHSSSIVAAHLAACAQPTGVSTGTLTITSNDPETPVLNVTVSLTRTAVLPDAVADLTVTPLESGVQLHWSPTALATRYRIYRSPLWPVGAIRANLVANVTDTIYTDAAATTNAFYTVTATR